MWEPTHGLQPGETMYRGCAVLSVMRICLYLWCSGAHSGRYRVESYVCRTALYFCSQIIISWPRGPMDKASAYGAGDCRLESCRGRYASGVLTHLHMRSPSRHVLTVGPCTITRTAVAPPGTSPCAMLATCLTRDGCIHVLQDARDRDALHHQANS